MSDAINKISSIKNKVYHNFDENKIKNLEARITGPSSNGNLPAQCEPLMNVDVELLKSSNRDLKAEFSSKSENNTITDSQKELLMSNSNYRVEIDVAETQNSNKSQGRSGKKSNTKRSEKKTKTSNVVNIGNTPISNAQFDFQNTKRHRSEVCLPNNIKENTNEHYLSPIEEGIEFSSKNVISSTQFFTKTRENATMMKDFIARGAIQHASGLVNSSFVTGKVQCNSNPYRPSEPKINEYFSKVSLSTSSTASKSNLDEKEMKLYNQNLNRLSDENDRLMKDCMEKTKIIMDYGKEHEKYRCLIRENEENIRNLTVVNRQYENNVNLGKGSLIKIMRELEEMKRAQKRDWINEQGLRLGRYAIQRAGSKVIEIWEEGEEFISIKNKIKDIFTQKEELEKQKKKLNYMKRKDMKDSNKDGKDSLINSNINLNESSENIEHEINEQKDLICFKLNLLMREEMELKARLEKLDTEKIIYQQEFNRRTEEDKCRYGTNQSPEKWPVLSNRYLVVSLLGKGGYSEVYKVSRL